MKLGRKITGGKYIKQRKKKRFERAGQRKEVKLGEEKRKTVRTTGGAKKTFLLRGSTINVQSKDKKQQTKIKNLEIISKTLLDPSFTAREGILFEGFSFKIQKGTDFYNQYRVRIKLQYKILINSSSHLRSL